MATTDDVNESDIRVPRQRLGDRFLWWVVRLLRIDEKAAKAVEQWLEERTGGDR
jgi:hypothetical protein